MGRWRRTGIGGCCGGGLGGLRMGVGCWVGAVLMGDKSVRYPEQPAARQHIPLNSAEPSEAPSKVEALP